MTLLKWSGVCGLCGDYYEHGKRLTPEPKLPTGVRDTAMICKTCKGILEDTDETKGCAWCGTKGGITIWDFASSVRGHQVPGYPITSLCHDCWKKCEQDYPAEFDESLKKKVRGDAGFGCEECGMPQDAHKTEFGQKLHVHHKDGNKQNNNLNNLTALCARCHGSK
jgi:5-methylcytosine-specific restriction endonuclease McrA